MIPNLDEGEIIFILDMEMTPNEINDSSVEREMRNIIVKVGKYQKFTIVYKVAEDLFTAVFLRLLIVSSPIQGPRTTPDRGLLNEIVVREGGSRKQEMHIMRKCRINID